MKVFIITTLIFAVIITIFNITITLVRWRKERSRFKANANSLTFTVRKKDIKMTYSDGYIFIKNNQLQVLGGNGLNCKGELDIPIESLWISFKSENLIDLSVRK